MKSLKRILAFMAVLAVFGVSFAMGHMTAVRSTELREAVIRESNEHAVAILPLLRASEEIEPDDDIPITAVSEPRTVMTAAPGEPVEEEREDPPFPLLSPVNGSVSEGYSIQAVYSETMHDWRAHTGTDYEASLAEAVMAAADGIVSRAYEDKLWGNVIEIEHKGGLKTVYKGVSTLSMVKVGKEVAAGDIISGVGTAPVESKAMPHLHFETWLDGICVNPNSYVVEING